MVQFQQSKYIKIVIGLLSTIIMIQLMYYILELYLESEVCERIHWQKTVKLYNELYPNDSIIDSVKYNFIYKFLE